jgi:hypothetical protein
MTMIFWTMRKRRKRSMGNRKRNQNMRRMSKGIL